MGVWVWRDCQEDRTVFVFGVSPRNVKLYVQQYSSSRTIILCGSDLFYRETPAPASPPCSVLRPQCGTRTETSSSTTVARVLCLELYR